MMSESEAHEKWAITMERIKQARVKFPEVVKWEAARNCWAKTRERLDALEEKASALKPKERELWDKMMEAKAALPQEAKEAFDL